MGEEAGSEVRHEMLSFISGVSLVFNVLINQGLRNAFIITLNVGQYLTITECIHQSRKIAAAYVISYRFIPARKLMEAEYERHRLMGENNLVK